MDTPLDFRLDRNRILSSGLSSASFGNYDSAFAESSRVSALNRSASSSISDLARIGTPASLSQFPSRYFHHAVGSQGSSYPLLGGYLPQTVSSADHLKSLLPEEYWASHGIDGTRYVLNNNSFYPPYLPYLPATESLSVYAHNLGTGAVDQSGYHRIYDLRKDAAIYPGISMVPSPTVSSQNSQNDTKKDTFRTESKRNESGKHVKGQDAVAKIHSSQKASKESEKRTDVKKVDKPSKPSSTLSKNNSSKREKVIKSDEKTVKEESKNSKKFKPEKYEKDVLMNDSKSNTDDSCETKESKEEDQDDIDKADKEDSNSEELKPNSNDTIIKCKGTTVVTMTTVTSSSSIVSTLESPVNHLKVSTATDPYTATTATTFSLPYYHSLFSTNHLSPPLPGSTVCSTPMCSEPVQTVPCDMRIKKEPVVSNHVDTNRKPVPDLKQNSKSDQKQEKADEKTYLKPKLASPVSTVATSTSTIMPLCLKKHILEKSKEWCKEEAAPNTDKKSETKSILKNVPRISDPKCTEKPNECEEDKLSVDFKPRHSKEIQQLTTTSKDTVKAISKVLSKRQESTESLKSDNSKLLSSPRKTESKLPTKRVLIKPKCDDKNTSGVSTIPIGIAVARKREDLKKDDSDENVGDSRDSSESSNGSSHNASSQERANEQQSSVTKSIPSVNVSQLPANLIVTGSATGAGIAWSDDPTARHFPTQWLQTPHQLNQSWIGQLPFQMPSSIPTSGTSDQTLPITLPPGYKIAQDSVTGQLVMIPSNDIEIYDPSRIWSSFAANPQPMLSTHASHQISQILPHSQDRAMPFVVQQYQQLLQNRQDNISSSDNTHNQNIQVVSGSIKNKLTKDASTKSKNLEKKTKSVGMVTPQITSDIGTSSQTLPYSYTGPVPLIVNPSQVSNQSESISLKSETSMVQSRGTSPMVPASEIEDTSQDMIDNSPVQEKTETVIRKDIINDDDESSFSSTDSSIHSRTCINEINTKVNSVVSPKHIVEIPQQTTPLKCDVTTKVDIQTSEVKNISDQTIGHDNCQDHTQEGQLPRNKLVKIDTEELVCNVATESSNENSSPEKKSDCVKSSDEYNPFLDPQILQAVDGLELLSALAERRSKSLDMNTDQISVIKQEKQDIKGKESEQKKEPEEVQQEKKQPAKRGKGKRTLSRTRSIPPIKEPETPSYYTSTGLRIPQDLHSFLEIGEEEINAIELDMRIRLAELQRQYKEKQKLLSKLQPKREKESPKDKDASDGKRGPGRPKKKNISSPSSDISEKKLSPKAKDGSIKKKKPAEELVDRVFRKTGGGFGMPLSKKLKANAMAALFKTQSGFTVKRKGSTSSLMASGKTLTSDKSSKTKKHVHKTSSEGKDSVLSSKVKEDENKSKIKAKVKKTKEDNSSKKWKNEKDEKDKEQSLHSGLGLLAKYATNALKQHIAAKKIKRKRAEGSLSEQATDSISTGEGDTAKNSDTNIPNIPCSTASSPNVDKIEEDDKKSESSSPEVKKRKPGRPRKGTPTGATGITETLVAKTSKNFQFQYQFQSFQDLAKKNNEVSERNQPKVEPESPMKPLFLDDEWLLRRSERIFLSDPSPQASPNYSQSIKNPAARPTNKAEPKSRSDQAKLQKARNMKELTQKVKRKYKKSMEKRTSQKARERKELEQKQRELKKGRSKSVDSKQPVNSYEDDSSESEGDNIPLSLLKDRAATPPPQRTCVLSEDDLKDGLNVLVFKDGLFYEGTVQPIHPPDIYGVLIKNERGNRPHIYSREEILKEVVLDLQPESGRLIPEGTRVCAYWSQQFNCLYPGTVSKGSPNPSPDKRFINVEFDDGDSGKIPVDHIRQLPADFPLVSYDPNPLLLIGKRRRHTTSDISETRKSESSVISEHQPKVKRGPGRPPKIKQENVSVSEMASDDEQDIDVCGFDDSETDTDKEDTDSVFGSQYSQKHKQTIKRKHKSDNDKDEKVKKKKVNADEKKKDRNVFEDQVLMPPRQWWRWHGKSTKRPGMKGKAKKEFYREIIRGQEAIKVGDCAVFVSTGRPHLPFIGRIDSMWESWGGQMTVKVKWFYHPEETRGGKKLQDMKRALFQSPHFDENDVQTISHKCEVISYTDYRHGNFDKSDSSDIYYLAGTYEPTIGLLKFEQDIM